MIGPAEDVLRVEHVSKTYPGEHSVQALMDVSLSLRAGDFAAVVGPSGSGKSTLLNLCGALDTPSSGRVILGGHDTSTATDKELSRLRADYVGFVFQQYHLVPTTTAFGNVEKGLLYQGLLAAERAERSTEALERVGLSHRADHRAGALSGGEQQRVAIARALVGRPILLLADEPTGSLDTDNSNSILQLLTEVNRQGVAILMITHSPDIASRVPLQFHIQDGLLHR